MHDVSYQSITAPDDTERRQCARSPWRLVSLSVTAWRAADMLGSRILLRPGDRERTGGLRRDVPGAWPPAEARLAGCCRGWHPSACPGSPPVSRHPVGSRPSRRRPRLPAASDVPAGAPRSPLRRDPRSALPWGATGRVRHARRTRMSAPWQSRKTLSAH